MTEKPSQEVAPLSPDERVRAAGKDLADLFKRHQVDLWVGVDARRVDDGSLVVRPMWELVAK